MRESYVKDLTHLFRLDKSKSNSQTFSSCLAINLKGQWLSIRTTHPRQRY